MRTILSLSLNRIMITVFVAEALLLNKPADCDNV